MIIRLIFRLLQSVSFILLVSTGILFLFFGIPEGTTNEELKWDFLFVGSLVLIKTSSDYGLILLNSWEEERNYDNMIARGLFLIVVPTTIAVLGFYRAHQAAPAVFSDGLLSMAATGTYLYFIAMITALLASVYFILWAYSKPIGSTKPF
ncbi:MAG: hypothetical protein AAB628_01930 [Patescibacteria group bacterium]